MRQTRIAIGLALGLSLGAGQALGQAPAADVPISPLEAKAPGGVIERVDAELVASVLRESSFEATVSQTEEGAPLIYGRYLHPDTKVAYEFSVTLFRCNDEKKCLDLSFVRAYKPQIPVTLQKVNAYNAGQIFGVAYLLTDGRTGISHAHTVEGGVTRENLKQALDWWRAVMTGFEDVVSKK